MTGPPLKRLVATLGLLISLAACAAPPPPGPTPIVPTAAETPGPARQDTVPPTPVPVSTAGAAPTLPGTPVSIGGPTAVAAPATATPTAPPVVAATPPTPLPVGELSLPTFGETTLENGLHVIVVPQRGLPLLTVQLVLPGGRSAEPVSLSGVSQVTAALLTRGTAARSGQEIARAIEQVGGSLSADAGQDALTITASVLNEHADLAFELLGDVALNPAFRQEELDAHRQRALIALRSTLASSGQVASRVFDALVYSGHPYGGVTTEQSLAAITREAVVDYYAGRSDPARAFLVVVGDVSTDEAAQRARASLGHWAATAEAADVAFPAPSPRTDRAIYLVDRPGSTQAEIVMGHPGVAGGTPERYALAVANQVLGGGSSGRLFRNLREEKGYTYGIYSGFSLPRDVGAFLVGAAVRNDVVEPALREVLAELERLRAEEVPLAELAAARSFLVGSFALRLETDTSLAAQVASLKLRGLPLSALQDYPRAIERVDAAAVRRVAQQHIRPAEAAIVVVGDATRIRDSLAAIAPITEVDADGRARQ